jgi:hypothetical protein
MNIFFIIMILVFTSSAVLLAIYKYKSENNVVDEEDYHQHGV